MAKKILTSLDLQSNSITNLATPSSGTDAATKTYVDGSIPVVNTNSNPGKKIYVGSIDPVGSYTLAVGDVWIVV